jgi:hypothetical protein
LVGFSKIAFDLHEKRGHRDLQRLPAIQQKQGYLARRPAWTALALGRRAD